ncbi:Programmed cell death protein 5, partial [Trichostrongylus colubriformis]
AVGQREDQQEEARKQAENQENALNSMLSQILDQQALVRLSNLAAAKPEKAKMVESAVINMARQFDRRRNNLDSDDDDY